MDDREVTLAGITAGVCLSISSAAGRAGTAGSAAAVEAMAAAGPYSVATAGSTTGTRRRRDGRTSRATNNPTTKMPAAHQNAVV